MTLKEHIDDIRDNLEKGLFTNEAAVSNSIVLRLLEALTWPRFNPQVIAPEYSVGGRRVDFALCHPSSKPIVFVEVKQVGNIDGAERQLFEYAFHEGVPIAILTDGREWRFFHPTAPGDYRERKVCELNLSEDDSEENAKRLKRYLNYESIRTGEAVTAIKEDYEKVVQQRQVATRLPEAWGKLLEEADEFLVDVVAEKTESLCGYRPSNEQVLNFLKNLERKIELDRRTSPFPSVQQDPTGSISRITQVSPQHQRAKTSPQRFIVTMPDGETIERPIKLETFVEVLLKLIERLGEEQVISADEKGSCVSTTPLRPGVQGRKYGKYFISTNHGTETKKRLLDTLAKNLRIRLKVEITSK